MPRSLYCPNHKMLSLSTSWNYRRHPSGEDIVKEISEAGFDTIELNFALSGPVVGQILAAKRRGAIKVSSLHNICPLPDLIPPDRASPDYYPLSSPDREERRKAVECAKNTVLCAKEFGAKAVVVHAGRVPIKDMTRKLAGLKDDPTSSDNLREEMVRSRKGASAPHLESTMRSLAEISGLAKDLGIAIGIENRYYYTEIPVFDEFEILFERFPPGELYYWHDVGHAEVFERLGLGSHLGLLEHFGERLIGMHLHDIIGLVNDHKAPGMGTFDFGIVKPYIKPDTILVMEVHEPATVDDIRGGANHLAKVLG